MSSRTGLKTKNNRKSVLKSVLHGVGLSFGGGLDPYEEQKVRISFGRFDLDKSHFKSVTWSVIPTRWSNSLMFQQINFSSTVFSDLGTGDSRGGWRTMTERQIQPIFFDCCKGSTTSESCRVRLRWELCRISCGRFDSCVRTTAQPWLYTV